MTARNILMSAAGSSGAATYIEDVFSTYLYTGNGSTQTITNGIDLAGKGGLVWRKQRTTNWWTAWTHHSLSDTARGVNAAISTSTTSAGSIGGDSFVTAFNTNGFSIGPDSSGYGTNKSTEAYASWTFRKQPKFFDVVTFTQSSDSTTTFSHNLGAVPGCIILKPYSANSFWPVYHTSTGANAYLGLNNSAGSNSYSGAFPSLTSTSITVNNALLATAGSSCVAYIFAHNAGGFGLNGTDNVISCGSYAGAGSVDLQLNIGYEPQWLLIKSTDGTTHWGLYDNMRGFDVSQSSQTLCPNLSIAETTSAGGTEIRLTNSGFKILANGGNYNASGTTYIYVAIRRGPMKTPTSGTSVFSPIVSSATQGTNQTTNFPVDLQILRERGSWVSTKVVDRLRGTTTTPTETNNPIIWTNETTAESIGSGWAQYWRNTGFSVPSGLSSISAIYWSFARAPGFFDEVCYTGTGVARTVNHNLGVAPELMIVKRRDTAANWSVYAASQGPTVVAFLNTINAFAASSVYWNNTNPTSSVFTLGTSTTINASGGTYVAYLFASCPGVSKVGSYTGTGAAQTINCGFTAGARFVLIKRSDSTGDWYVWDTARGIISGNDPYLLINGTAAEVTTTDYISPQAVGFGLTATAPAALNASGGTYIFFAVA